MSLLELLNATDSYLVALAVLCVIATRISSGDDRTSTPFRLFLVMLDLDGFKAINDRFGHAEGDEALKATAQVLRRCLHADDFIARFAGDEFVVIAGLREPGDAATLVERIRRAFEAYNEDSGRPWRLQASIGAVTSEELPAGALNRAKLIVREADRRMYEDKGTRSR